MPSPQLIINRYRDHLTRAGKSPHTIRAYVQDATAFARWFKGTTGGAFKPQAVDPRDIQDYRGYLVRRELAPATVNRRLKALKSLFRWARRENLVTEIPSMPWSQSFSKSRKTRPHVG